MKSSSRTRGSRSRPERHGIDLEQLRDGGDQHADLQIAIARADEGGERGIHLDDSAECSTLAKLDHTRTLGAGKLMPRLRDVARDDQHRVGKFVILQPDACIVRGKCSREV